MKTPILIPVVNLLTGPPGLGRNGGIWRHCKEGLIRGGLAESVMVQAVHFVDFTLSPESFRNWFDGPDGMGGFGEWFRRFMGGNQTPNLFVDSGGFKLLYNDPPDLSKYSIKVSSKEIFRLQTQYSADLVASLDYPLPPGLSQDEQRSRTRKNIKNAIQLMDHLTEFDSGPKPFPFLCVHGVDYESVKRSTIGLLARLSKSGYGESEFGLAIGSLVPIRKHDDMIFAIIRGVHEAIKSSGKSVEEIPIHVFGVSSSLIPLLPAVGVDSFDSSTYAQAAANLRYLDPISFGRVDFGDVKTLTCNCDSCEYLKRGGLKQAQGIAHSLPYLEYEFAGEAISKARILGAIAVHNWTVQRREVERTTTAIREGHLSDLISSLATRSKKFLRVVRAAVAANPELRNFIDFAKSLPSLPEPHEIRPGRLSLAYTPESFDLSRTRYLPRNKTLLILSCTVTKPYSLSRSHKYLVTKLAESGVFQNSLEIVTVSGLYGPVPRNMESRQEIMKYDFRLSKANERQISIVSGRMTRFLERHGSSFSQIAAFISSEPYRSIVQRACKAAKLEDFRMFPSGKGRFQFYKQSEVESLAMFLVNRDSRHFEKQHEMRQGRSERNLELVQTAR